MGRRDFYDDADAPLPNSVVPAASAVVTDDNGRILVHRRRDNGLWALPGGVLELGESLSGCAVREVREETGLDIEVTGIVGVYSDPRHVYAYDDGEVRQEFSVCFAAHVIGGELSVSDESYDVNFCTPADIERLPMVDSIRLRIVDFLSGETPAIR